MWQSKQCAGCEWKDNRNSFLWGTKMVKHGSSSSTFDSMSKTSQLMTFDKQECENKIVE